MRASARGGCQTPGLRAGRLCVNTAAHFLLRCCTLSGRPTLPEAPGTISGYTRQVVAPFERICLYTPMLDGAVLNALADPRRRAILRLVRDVERPSGEIAAEFPDVTGPAISQHLRVLREAGLLAERRSGTRRLYRARPEGLRELRAWIREF